MFAFSIPDDCELSNDFNKPSHLLQSFPAVSPGDPESLTSSFSSYSKYFCFIRNILDFKRERLCPFKSTSDNVLKTLHQWSFVSVFPNLGSGIYDWSIWEWARGFKCLDELNLSRLIKCWHAIRPLQKSRQTCRIMTPWSLQITMTLTESVLLISAGWRIASMAQD